LVKIEFGDLDDDVTSVASLNDTLLYSGLFFAELMVFIQSYIPLAPLQLDAHTFPIDRSIQNIPLYKIPKILEDSPNDDDDASRSSFRRYQDIRWVKVTAHELDGGGVRK
jgi:hypothetical protein